MSADGKLAVVGVSAGKADLTKLNVVPDLEKCARHFLRIEWRNGRPACVPDGQIIPGTEPRSVAVAPDGQHALACGAAMTAVIDLTTRQVVLPLPGGFSASFMGSRVALIVADKGIAAFNIAS